MDAIVAPISSWDLFPESDQRMFKIFRSSAREQLILESNLFIEKLLPGKIYRTLTDVEMTEDRRLFAETGESRRPTIGMATLTSH
jgi:haloalkane dehalogenase